jgi:hypothetical protein
MVPRQGMVAAINFSGIDEGNVVREKRWIDSVFWWSRLWPRKGYSFFIVGVKIGGHRRYRLQTKSFM